MRFQNINEQEAVHQLERLMTAVDYSGERYVIKTREGLSAAIVPLEDLEILEQLEKPSLQHS